MFASKDIFLTPPSGGYQISRSVRLRSSASAYFNRTPASAGSLTTWTWSGWIKRGTLGASQAIFSSGTSGITLVHFQADNTLRIRNSTVEYVTTQVFRDPSAWYHIVLQWNTTNGTAANRVLLYVNGVQVTSFSTQTTASSSEQSEWNKAQSNEIGRYAFNGTLYTDGYLTEINFIDGQALTPSSFGETDTLTGVWKPKKYTGTYGTNGFYLNFSDNSNNTAATIGKDYSGNGNNWTPNNISVTAGVTYDSMLDVPTPYADGGNGRGNYAVMNPLNNTGTLSNANLTFTGTDKAVLSTIAIPTSGKYYFEATCTTVANFSTIGIANVLSQASSFNGVIASANFRTYNSGGEKADSTRTAGWGSTFTSGDVIGVAVDMDNGAIYFAKNNTWQASGVPTSGASKTGAAFTDLTSSGITWTAFFSAQNSSGVWSPTFGQRPFSYTPPTGFVALNTQNLPTPTISNGANYMAASLWTGTGATQSITNTVNGISFQPDFVWNKSRSTTYSNEVTDSVRGTTQQLYTNLTDAEYTASNQLTSFNSNGFTISTGNNINASGQTYVGWQWKAGGTAVTNTSGTITSSVSANTTAGFSIVTYTGNSTASATVGHGLGVAPTMIIIKNRSAVQNWPVAHTSLAANNLLLLDTTNATISAGTRLLLGNSTTFTVGDAADYGISNQSAQNYVAYCFSAVAGYSKFGSYTGNGSSDGVFVHLDFRARYLLIKETGNANSWEVYDTSRNTANVQTKRLFPNDSLAEATTDPSLDILSNGFKCRAGNTGINRSGGTYIYAAFAENPFKISLAR